MNRANQIAAAQNDLDFYTNRCVRLTDFLRRPPRGETLRRLLREGETLIRCSHPRRNQNHGRGSQMKSRQTLITKLRWTRDLLLPCLLSGEVNLGKE
jgi:hypothetical protein